MAFFLAQVGLTLTNKFQIPPHSNVSLDYDVQEFFRLCNAVPMEQKTRVRLRRSLETVSQQFAGRNYFQSHSLLSPRERIEILEHYEESNRYVAREYLGREDGRLFYEPWPDKDEPWEPYDGLTQEKLAQIMVRLCLLQQEGIEALQRRSISIWADRAMKHFGITDWLSRIKDRLAGKPR